jgi:uncharacterized protein (DUF934 family)
MSTGRRILTLQGNFPDPWRYPDEPADPTDGHVVPLAELRARAHDALPAPLGVQLAPADAVEDLLPLLHRLQLVVAVFPGPGEGRGFTQARLLRQRHHFTGEIRARGAGVKQDRLLLFARCGFDTFDLAPGESEEEARAALSRYTVAYQDADPALPLRRRASA